MPPSLYVFQEKPIYFETEGNIKLKYETGFKNENLQHLLIKTFKNCDEIIRKDQLPYPELFFENYLYRLQEKIKKINDTISQLEIDEERGNEEVKKIIPEKYLSIIKDRSEKWIITLSPKREKRQIGQIGTINTNKGEYRKIKDLIKAHKGELRTCPQDINVITNQNKPCVLKIIRLIKNPGRDNLGILKDLLIKALTQGNIFNILNLQSFYARFEVDQSKTAPAKIKPEHIINILNNREWGYQQTGDVMTSNRINPKVELDRTMKSLDNTAVNQLFRKFGEVLKNSMDTYEEIAERLDKTTEAMNKKLEQIEKLGWMESGITAEDMKRLAQLDLEAWRHDREQEIKTSKIDIMNEIQKIQLQEKETQQDLQKLERQVEIQKIMTNDQKLKIEEIIIEQNEYNKMDNVTKLQINEDIEKRIISCENEMGSMKNKILENDRKIEQVQGNNLQLKSEYETKEIEMTRLNEMVKILTEETERIGVDTLNLHNKETQLMKIWNEKDEKIEHKISNMIEAVEDLKTVIHRIETNEKSLRNDLNDYERRMETQRGQIAENTKKHYNSGIEGIQLQEKINLLNQNMGNIEAELTNLQRIVEEKREIEKKMEENERLKEMKIQENKVITLAIEEIQTKQEVMEKNQEGQIYSINQRLDQQDRQLEKLSEETDKIGKLQTTQGLIRTQLSEITTEMFFNNITYELQTLRGMNQWQTYINMENDIKLLEESQELERKNNLILQGIDLLEEIEKKYDQLENLMRSNIYEPHKQIIGTKRDEMNNYIIEVANLIKQKGVTGELKPIEYCQSGACFTIKTRNTYVGNLDLTWVSPLKECRDENTHYICNKKVRQYSCLKLHEDGCDYNYYTKNTPNEAILSQYQRIVYRGEDLYVLSSQNKLPQNLTGEQLIQNRNTTEIHMKKYLGATREIKEYILYQKIYRQLKKLHELTGLYMNFALLCLIFICFIYLNRKINTVLKKQRIAIRRERPDNTYLLRQLRAL